MSLTSFLDIKDVNDKIKALRPKLSRKINVPLQIEPRSGRYTLVGTAFDYLVRFEIQRKAACAVARRWIAEDAADMICRKMGPCSVGLDLLKGVDSASYLPPKEIANRARVIVDNAKAMVDIYLKTENPNIIMLSQLAAHAIRLSKLDSIYRVRRLEPQFEEVDYEDVQDLISMFALVPFKDFLDDNLLLLNPDFGDASHLVGGADVDLISGNLLLDVKVTKENSISVKILDQLLGYFLLSRYQRRLDGVFPDIKYVAVYFARHGYLWKLDVAMWTNHESFEEIEKWFFERAKEIFNRPGKIRK